jgi:acylphosphatase
MRKRVDARFTGKVQGVYFRDFTCRYSDELGVKGWVMNCPDGTVQAVFEGEESDIIEVIRRLREEHPIARVDGIDLKWSGFTGDFRDFETRYFDL